MERRQFTREFKLEGGPADLSSAALSYATGVKQDLGVHPTQLRNWV